LRAPKGKSIVRARIEVLHVVKAKRKLGKKVSSRSTLRLMVHDRRGKVVR
jgi:hypothetical protein